MAQEKKKVTISDIAAAAGVSKATVSRYINGRSELMTDKTRERIQTVIELLDYHPSAAARSLKTKKNRQIGVLLSNIETPFAASLIVGIGTCLHQKGYEPLFVDCHNSIQKEEEAIASFMERTVEGLLVNTTFIENPALIKASCDGCNIVLCDRFVNHYDFNIVTIEQDESMLRLIRHLKEMGYTRPVLFAQQWEKNSTRQRRLKAFLRAVEQVYGYVPAEDIYTVGHEQSQSEEQLDILLSRLQPGEIPAIVGINSETTVLAYRAIVRRGLKIPEQMGLCGSEDWDWESVMNWATLLQPAITSISIPTKEMGYRAAELLLQIIEGEHSDPQTVILPCELVVRGSTRLKG